MNANYIEMIKGILGEMDKKKMDPVGKADADIDNDGDVDSSDKYLHKRRKAISKSMKKEDDDKMTPCPKCDGSMENHDPECPNNPDNKGKSDAEEGCGNYEKKMKKEAKKDKGNETLENILLLCPNHHKEFDLGDLNIVFHSKEKIEFTLNENDYEITLLINS